MTPSSFTKFQAKVSRLSTGLLDVSTSLVEVINDPGFVRFMLAHGNSSDAAEKLKLQSILAYLKESDGLSASDVAEVSTMVLPVVSEPPAPTEEASVEKKRGRGRPRKVPQKDEAPASVVPPTPKRARPRKSEDDSDLDTASPKKRSKVTGFREPLHSEGESTSCGEESEFEEEYTRQRGRGRGNNSASTSKITTRARSASRAVASRRRK